MKIKEAIRRTDLAKPNAFEEELKFLWLTALEGQIAADVFLMAPAETEQFEYSYPDGLDMELLVKPPYDELYVLYLVENLHEGNSACRSSCNVSYFTALWTKAGNVDADAAAVRENAGDLVVGLEDRFQIILRRRKDIAVGKGNFELALGACSIESAACRTEGSFFQISSHSWTQVIIKNRTDAVHELFRVCFTLVIILLSQDALADFIVVPVIHNDPPL